MLHTIEIPDFPAVAAGIIVFFLGAFLTRRVAVLKNYNIPEPVAGGLAAALITWAAYSLFDVEIAFDLSTRDELLVVFFVTIGLNARISDLVAGGRMLGILLAVTIAFIILQNCVGLLGTLAFDLPRPVSVLLGSASLIGGHGTAIAWGPTIEAATGFEASAEIGIASATLGLVCAALIGGPIAKYLIDRHQLEAKADGGPVVGLPYESDGLEAGAVNHISIMRSILAIYIAIIIGYVVDEAIASAGLKLPLFVSCLLVAIAISNTVPMLFPNLPWPARTRALAVISDYSLSVFLAMSLMSMQLWTLAGLGGPLIGVLILQVLGTSLFIVFLFFRLMDSNYTAAVLSSGFAGFTLGATPTAIANMSSVTKRYGPAPLAFIILPMVSAFFVDLANALIIRYFVAL
ncbi:sodium/glutamate symporter [Hoeflea sp. TYP-13]|uniref:sodium/glutamate symporter n=1 Tax=Hoeflea sp. TYP-13 TaxID=3230023 RepID=UPI0034C670EF